MHRQPVFRSQIRRQFVNSQIGLRVEPVLRPVPYTGQLAATRVALRLWCTCPGIALEPHHIVDTFDRNAKPPGRFGMRVSWLNQRNSALPSF